MSYRNREVGYGITYVQGLALLGDLKVVRPVLLPNRITDDEINNKKPNRYSSDGTEDAMLLRLIFTR
jgi:hypothetical protein